jgi:hypothetical protein
MARPHVKLTIGESSTFVHCAGYSREKEKPKGRKQTRNRNRKGR